MTRIGATRARQLALTGARFDGRGALHYGLVHDVFEEDAQLQTQLTQTLTSLSRRRPRGTDCHQATHALGRSTSLDPLDRAASGFAHAATEGEGMAGMMVL